jgi:hypothetical protein
MLKIMLHIWERDKGEKFGLIILRYEIEGALICETNRVTIRETTQ